MATQKLFPIALTVNQAAKALGGIDRKIIYQFLRVGLPRYRIGTRKLILVDDLVEFIRTHLERAKL